ncbi:hypothetical protein HMPREF9141_2354 [Prevotella multiformis DSM 16608]|uniref:Uncharacterized protein n=1 Tax=Prevotella multiformis DSM 16608 TaxID=888743 RepID=F0F9T7_9BACT|nr:hypothetical protein HMPREF9141_2354 [Prevotella multiformis DSM 16608]
MPVKPDEALRSGQEQDGGRTDTAACGGRKAGAAARSKGGDGGGTILPDEGRCRPDHRIRSL